MKKGFTLIELLVVIAIIAILAGLVIVRIGQGSKDARHAERLSDMNSIKKAIQMFEIEGGSINPCTPGQSPPCTCSNIAGNISEGGNTIHFISANGKYPNDYLQGGSYPQDNNNGGLNSSYGFTVITNGSYGNCRIQKAYIHVGDSRIEDPGLKVDL